MPPVARFPPDRPERRGCALRPRRMTRPGSAGLAAPAAGTAGRGRHYFTAEACVSADVVLEGEDIWPPAWRARAAEGGVVSFVVEGDYFEVCNCEVSCNCVWLGAATQDHCDVLFAWHVTSGSKDGVDLSGLNAVMAVHSPKRMTD